MAKAFAFDSQGLGALKGRIKHLRKQGLPLGLTPGTGNKIDYSPEQVMQWALALELTRFGVDPSKAASAISEQWEDGLKDHVLRPTERGNDKLIVFRPDWALVSAIGPQLRLIPIEQENLHRHIGANILVDHRRTCVMNLTELLRSLERAGLELEA